MNPPSLSPAPAKRQPRNVVLAVLAIAAVLVGGYYGIRHWQFVSRHEDTDDAQVEGDIGPVLPRISGYVARVLVRDNQVVKAGDPLIEIDVRELDLKVAQAAAGIESAQAALQNAQAGLANAEAAEKVAAANITSAAVTEAKTAADLARDNKLFQTNAITERELSDTRAAAEIARARTAALRRQEEAAASQIAVAQTQIAAAQAQVKLRHSDLDYAELQRSYATVTAPIAGAVSRKSIEPGQYVQAGQTLLSIVSDTNPWVVANFKETQLARIRIGQTVEIRADGYPGTIFPGRVESISGATGARFALLPPDNSSGNFVKVTQRVPVKISLEPTDGPQRRLRPGMSVDAAVQIKE